MSAQTNRTAWSHNGKVCDIHDSETLKNDDQKPQRFCGGCGGARLSFLLKLGPSYRFKRWKTMSQNIQELKHSVEGQSNLQHA